MEEQGFNYDNMLHSYKSHSHSASNIISTLNKVGANVHLLTIDEFERGSREFLHDVDLIVTAGGDGTILQTVGRLRGHRTLPPVIGVNTDPVFSHGKLCTWSMGLDSDFQEVGLLIVVVAMAFFSLCLL